MRLFNPPKLKVTRAKAWEDEYRAEIVMHGSTVYEFHGMLHLGVDLVSVPGEPPTTVLLAIPEKVLV